MKDVSRRSLLAASIATPLMTPGAKRRRRDLSTLLQTGNDPLVERASAWAVDAANVEAMQHRWQDLESIVFDRAHELNISCSDACDSDWPEAREMRFFERADGSRISSPGAQCGKSQPDNCHHGVRRAFQD